MDKLPWMPFYGRDFLTDERVRLLSRSDRMLYLEMLWHDWEEGSIPADLAQLACLFGAPEPTVAELAHTFFVPNGTSDRLVNPRLHQVRDRHVAERRGKSLGGKRSRRVLKQSANSLERQPGENQIQNQRQKKNNHLSINTDVQQVLNFYAQTHPRRRVRDGRDKFIPKLVKLVEKALKLGFSVEDLKNAITGNANDSWHQEQAKHELGYILRDADHINDFVERFHKQQHRADDDNAPVFPDYPKPFGADPLSGVSFGQA